MTAYEFEMRWEGGQRIIIPIVRWNGESTVEDEPDCVYVTARTEDVERWAKKERVSEADVTGFLESLYQSDESSGFFYSNNGPSEFYVRKTTYV